MAHNPEPLTLNRLHDQWAKEPRWRKLAGTTLQAALAVFLREHGDTPINRCTAAMMSRWLDETQAGAADTVLALSCLRNMADWANDGGLLPFRGADIRLDAEALNRRGALASRPATQASGTIKPGNGGRRWPKEAPTVPESRNKETTESRKVRKSVAPSLRESVKSVGKRVKHVAEKALHKDFKERFSSKWIGKGIGRVLDHQKEPGKAKMKTGRRAPGGTAYTDSQHTIRNTAKGMGYRVGDATRSDDRLIIYVTPEAKRSALRERTWARHGFTLCHADGTPAAPLERQGYDEVKGALVYRLKKRGFTFDGTRVTVPAGLQLNPRTERALRWKGFVVVTADDQVKSEK